MKSSKKSSREPSLPSQDETRRANVLREEMLSQFRVFGESLSIVREGVEHMKPRLDQVFENVEILKSAVLSNGQNIQAIRADLKNIHQRLEVVEAK